MGASIWENGRGGASGRLTLPHMQSCLNAGHVEPLLDGVEIVADGRVGTVSPDVVDVESTWGREGKRQIGKSGRDRG